MTKWLFPPVGPVVKMPTKLPITHTPNEGVAPWTPRNLFAGGRDGLWIDPSDLSTLWRDTDGTMPVTTDGQTVALAQDKSGNSNNLTQANSSQRPAYNQLGYLACDGSDDVLMRVFGAAKPFPLHIISGIDVAASDNNNIVSLANPGSSTNIIASQIGTGPAAVTRYGTGLATSSIATTTGKHVLSTKFYSGNQSVSVDGGPYSTPATEVAAYSGLTRFGMGAFVDSTPFYAAGTFYGLIAVFAELSAEEDAQAVAWMKSKMGIV